MKIVDGFLTHQIAAHLSLVGLECSSGIVDWNEILDRLLLVGLCLLDRLGAPLDLDQEKNCYRRRWGSHHAHAHAHVPVLGLGLDRVLVLALGVLIGSPD